MFREWSELRQIRSFRRVFLPLSVTFFIYTFGWGVVSPIFSIYVNQVTGSATLTGIVLSLTTMAGIVLNIPFGILESRLNMKRVLQVSLLAYAGLALLYPAAHTLPALLLLSVGRGIASSFLWLTSWAYVLSYAEKKVKGKETGFFSDLNDMASAVSPVLGGFVALISIFFPFYLLSLTSLLALGVATAFLRESPTPQYTPWKTQVQTVSRYLRDHRFVKTILLIVGFYALINVYYGFLAILLHGEGLAIDWIGIVLTVALAPAVALEVPIGGLIDRVGVRKTLAVAVTLTAATALLLPLSGDIVWALVVVTAFTVSYTAIFIALYSRMSDTMQQDKVAMTGAIATFKDLGYTLGPLSAGFLIPVVGIHDTFLIAGGAFLLLLPIAWSLQD
jgi:DHA1 family multidrug resistance protein-like MFS transporter